MDGNGRLGGHVSTSSHRSRRRNNTVDSLKIPYIAISSTEIPWVLPKPFLQPWSYLICNFNLQNESPELEGPVFLSEQSTTSLLRLHLLVFKLHLRALDVRHSVLSRFQRQSFLSHPLRPLIALSTFAFVQCIVHLVFICLCISVPVLLSTDFVCFVVDKSILTSMTTAGSGMPQLNRLRRPRIISVSELQHSEPFIFVAFLFSDAFSFRFCLRCDDLLLALMAGPSPMPFH
jgi:hypothetical protein